MDEIQSAIMGWVDNKRIERDHAFGIVLSSGNYKTQPNKYSMFPLPYDDELTGKLSANEMEAFVAEYKELWEGKL